MYSQSNVQIIRHICAVLCMDNILSAVGTWSLCSSKTAASIPIVFKWVSYFIIIKFHIRICFLHFLTSFGTKIENRAIFCCYQRWQRERMKLTFRIGALIWGLLFLLLLEHKQFQGILLLLCNCIIINSYCWYCCCCCSSLALLSNRSSFTYAYFAHTIHLVFHPNAIEISETIWNF